MSYAWLLPPLCDPLDGHLLMDGCYVNNVPGDVMAAQGCKYILAVDVTTLDDRDLTNYGDSLSGWWLLWNKINVFAAKPIKIPTQADIQLRLAFWYVCFRANAQYEGYLTYKVTDAVPQQPFVAGHDTTHHIKAIDVLFHRIYDSLI